MRTLDKKRLSRRNLIYSALIVLLFVFLLSGFVRLQLTNKAVYIQQSMNNSIRRVELYPVRGYIKDRHGKILVDTHPAYSIAAIPSDIDSSSVHFLEKTLNIDKSEIDKKLKNKHGFRPVVMARDISLAKLTELEENRLSLPGILPVVDTKRYFPPGISSPHIFGTVGEVSEQEQAANHHYQSGDMVGKSGLEKKYDLVMRGTKGLRFDRIDARGKELGMYDKNRNLPPVHGDDLYLYMDYELQSFAEGLLEGKRGSLVAIDTRNGGIIALASKPDYDPRILSGKIDSETWKALISDESHPLYSRSVQSAYPPGSTYKIVAAAAALQEKTITKQWTAYCPGYFKLGRKTIHCWAEKGHGTLDLLGAIKNSCNVYFFKLGLKIGLDTWSKYSTIFRFGQRTGIDLPNENPGLVPTRAYFNKIYGENGWTRGNLANLAIGQGELLTTPLQIAQFAMILANKGVYYTPHLVDHTYNYSSQKNVAFPVETKYINGISQEVYDIVREGMHRVANGGTGWRARVRGVDMAGKTGTAQNPHGNPHAWFMGFAPYDLPQVAIAVIVENGGGGGAVAAPIARRFLEKYFYGQPLPQLQIKKDSTQATPLQPLVPINIDAISPLPVILPGDTL